MPSDPPRKPSAVSFSSSSALTAGVEDGTQPTVAESIDALFSHPTTSSQSASVPGAAVASGGGGAAGGASADAERNVPKPGPWIGVDLGTSNCSCAAWDSGMGEAATLPLKRGGLGRPGDGRCIVPSAVLLRWKSDGKGGATDDGEGWEDAGDVLGVRGLEALVGDAAVGFGESASARSKYSASDVAGATVTSVKRVMGMTAAEARTAAAANASASASASAPAAEKRGGGGFLDSLPFEARLVVGDGGGEGGEGEDAAAAVAGGSAADEGLAIAVRPLGPCGEDDDADDATADVVLVSPLRLAALLLRSIRRAAQSALSTGRYSVPGLTAGAGGADADADLEIHNVVLGVPAHFSLPRRRAVVRAARLSGFAGHVGTVTESTAAAVAYGLFVSPDRRRDDNAAAAPDDGGEGAEGGEKEEEGKEDEEDANDEGSGSEDEEGWTAVSVPSAGVAAAGCDGSSDAKKVGGPVAGGAPKKGAPVPSGAKLEESVPPRGKAILVFDMGGGTTDVTIASMASSSSSPSGEKGRSDEEKEDVRFRVLATAGDNRLGGDDLDEALARLVREAKLRGDGDANVAPTSSARRRRLRGLCRDAKEKLCGNAGGEDGMDESPPLLEAEFDFDGAKVMISREEFERAIAPLVARAEGVVREAMQAYQARAGNVVDSGGERDGGLLPPMDEVILVGGSTRTPSIRSMLSRLFPPPTPPELCTSVDPERAVGRGCAIRSAAASGLVPKWELRNALMLDALPHGMGVLVGGPAGEGRRRRYVPVLCKDAPLPAMDHARFVLADPTQPGITVVAAEDVHGHCDADGDEGGLQEVGTFTFLLHRPAEVQLRQLEEEDRAREILVGMTVGTDGRFIVSVFDELDPEHAERRRRYLTKRGEMGGVAEGATVEVDGGDENKDEGGGKVSSSSTMEELFLTVACVLVVIFYVAARMAFSVPPDEEDGSRIL